MPSAKEIELALLESAWKRIGAYLEDERHLVHEEIKNYPRPIPACDLQFNHLLEKRAGICQELDRMREATRESLRAGDSLDALAEFIRSSSTIDTEMKKKIKSALEEGLSELEAKLAGR
jgi:hypothetical protein